MAPDVFRTRPPLPADVCGHCGAVVDRVWLVPGDVLDSCRRCFTAGTGQPPVHEQGHTSVVSRPEPARGTAAAFYLRADGRRPA